MLQSILIFLIVILLFSLLSNDGSVLVNACNCISNNMCKYSSLGADGQSLAMWAGMSHAFALERVINTNELKFARHQKAVNKHKQIEDVPEVKADQEITVSNDSELQEHKKLQAEKEAEAIKKIEDELEAAEIKTIQEQLCPSIGEIKGIPVCRYLTASKNLLTGEVKGKQSVFSTQNNQYYKSLRARKTSKTSEDNKNTSEPEDLTRTFLDLVEEEHKHCSGQYLSSLIREQDRPAHIQNRCSAYVPLDRMCNQLMFKMWCRYDKLQDEKLIIEAAWLKNKWCKMVWDESKPNGFKGMSCITSESVKEKVCPGQAHWQESEYQLTDALVTDKSFEEQSNTKQLAGLIRQWECPNGLEKSIVNGKPGCFLVQPANQKNKSCFYLVPKRDSQRVLFNNLSAKK